MSFYQNREDTSLRHRLLGSSFRFDRLGGSRIGVITLAETGEITGINSTAEKRWDIDGGRLVFLDADNRITTIFEEKPNGDFLGDFVPEKLKGWHILTKSAVSALLLSDIKDNLFGSHLDAYDVIKCAELAAAFDSSNYYVEKMTNCNVFYNKIDLLSAAMAIRPPDGLILEFGVFSGTTINHIAQLTQERVYGFDAFTGLPEEWRPGFAKGAFNVSAIPAVRSNVELVVGLFENTLGPFKDRNRGMTASLIHIDCDIYNSTVTVFRELSEMIVKGTIIVFDEYFNYPGWRQHEYRAFQEYVTKHNKTYEYVSLVANHQQVGVRITS